MPLNRRKSIFAFGLSVGRSVMKSSAVIQRITNMWAVDYLKVLKSKRIIIMPNIDYKGVCCFDFNAYLSKNPSDLHAALPVICMPRIKNYIIICKHTDKICLIEHYSIIF